jgi:hypothetical protein
MNPKRPSIIILISVILLTFLIPVLLLLKIIRVEPNAFFAQKLLLFSVAITMGTFAIQTIYFVYFKNRIKSIKTREKQKEKLYTLFTIRMGITLVAIVANFVFLALTNFDMFLVINIVSLLWMINIFPYNDKINHILNSYSLKN